MLCLLQSTGKFCEDDTLYQKNKTSDVFFRSNNFCFCLSRPLNLFSVFYLEIRAGPPKSVFQMPEFWYKAPGPHCAGERKNHRPFWI